MAELDDDRRRSRTRSAALRPGAELAHARGGGPLALGGRLDRRHERDPRGHDPAALVVSTAPSRSAACRRRRWRSWRAARRRSAQFKPEPYWVVDAAVRHRQGPRPRELRGPLPRRREPADQDRRRGRRDRRRRATARPARSPSSRRRERKERAPLLYDLTSLQRDANSRFGFSARRTLAAAQRLYEEHKALTYPRTNSRYITGDMIGEIKPIATARRRAAASTRRPRSTCSGSTCCRSGAWSTTRRSPTTTRSSRPAPSATRSRR